MITSLGFQEINERYESISLPHNLTLEWIFSDQTLGFESWLRSGKGMFWIKGKPGSGKSTLMRFLRDDSRTAAALRMPEIDQKRVVVWFFFHERGSYMQNSYEALLRSILFQIVSQDTGSAKALLPLYLSQGSDAITRGNWSVDKLEAGLAMVLKMSTEITFLLDALDEFVGPPKFIAEFLAHLVKPTPLETSSSVRICFSSREWDEFEKAFGKYPNFQIHEHTRNAIISYATERLEDAKLDSQLSAWNAAKRIKITPPASPSRGMALELADLAKGVFLWVRIVIDKLLEISQTPTLEELRKLLSRTPEDLGDLYKRAIGRLPNDHRVEAFVMLELVSRVGTPDLELVVLAPAFAFCETAAECVDVIKRARSKEWFAQKTELKRRLRNRCGGLLDIISDHCNRVQFMHQTVKDFVEDLAFENHVFGPYHSPYYENGHSFWMKHCFSMLHTLDGSTPFGTSLRYGITPFGKEWGYIRPESLVQHARLAEPTTGRSQAAFLDSVPDELIEGKFFRQQSTDWFPINTVMAFAVVADLRLYVRQKLIERGSQIVDQNPEVSLLFCAVWSARRFGSDNRIRNDMGMSTFNLYDMVKLLLEHGADTNATFRGVTPLEYLSYRCDHSTLDMDNIARLISEHRRNPNVLWWGGYHL